MDTKPVVVVRDVSFAYPGNSELVLQHVNLAIYEKEFIWVVGPNGGGKTTLMKLLLGLLKPLSGTIEVFGSTPAAARKRIGYMPQAATLDPKFPVTVMDVVLMGRLNNFKAGWYTAADKNAAIHALEQVGLAALQHRRLHELSGGQQRRLLIARALSSKPDLLILDEPTVNLDQQVEQELYRLLKQLNEHLTILMVSHDPAFVSDFVKKVVCVTGTVAVHPTSDVLKEKVGDLYGGKVRLVRHDKHQENNRTYKG